MLMFLDIDVRSVLPSIDVPTLVIHGESDLLPFKVARELVDTDAPGECDRQPCEQ